VLSALSSVAKNSKKEAQETVSMSAVVARKPPLSCSECPIRTFTAYFPLISKHPEILQGIGREIVELPARRVILRKGETPSRLFTLFSGWAFRFTLLPDGRRQILSFVLPGEMISLRALQATPMNFAVQALTNVVLCSFDAARLRKAMAADPAQTEYLVSKYIDICIEADLRLTDLGRRSASERIIRLVLGLERRLAARNLTDDDTFDFPLRQEHIADALGLTAVHVSRTLSALRDADAISLEHGRMTIRNRARLLDMVDDAEPLARR
jgi:CRP/FNR family transcriptional regulator, anaerobic regulatory protein